MQSSFNFLILQGKTGPCSYTGMYGTYYYVSLVFDMFASNLAFQIHYNVSDNAYYSIVGYCFLFVIPLLILVLLATTLCLARHRRQWFLIEPGRYNPYRLVYRVTKFSYQHKTPVQRSAFTYCEVELPAPGSLL